MCVLVWWFKEKEALMQIRPPLSWNQIADHMSMIEGRDLSRQRCQAIATRALQKLAIALEDDPLVRDYLEETKVVKSP